MLDLIHVWTVDSCMLVVPVLWKQMTEVGVTVTRRCDKTSVVDRAGTARDFAVRLESGQLHVGCACSLDADDGSERVNNSALLWNQRPRSVGTRCCLRMMINTRSLRAE